MRPSATSRLQVLGAALLFSSGGAAIKACSLNGWQVAGFRSVAAAAFLALALPGGRAFWRPRTLAVGVAYAATMILFVTANKLTTAANTIFLQSTAPLYLLLLGPWLLGERVRRVDLIFAAVLAAGMALFFVGVEPPQQTAPAPAAGNLLAAASGVSWALTILGLRWLAREEGPDSRPAEAAVIAGNVIAAACCLPLALPVLHARPADWVLIVFLGVLQIGLAYLLLLRGVRSLPALEASLLLLLEPVSNPLWVALVHDERPGAWSLAGCAVIFAATTVRAAAGRS